MGAPCELDIVVRGARLVEARERRGGNPVPHHEFLGELLGALQPRAGPRRAEDAKPSGTEQIDDAIGERRLGPHHGQVDVFGARKIGELVDH